MAEQPVPPPLTGKFAKTDTLLALALCAIVFLVHAASPNATPFDSRWTIHTAVSLLEEHNADLNEYRDTFARDGFYLIECVESGAASRLLHGGDTLCDGRLFHYYPLAVPLLAALPVAGISAAVWVAGPLLRPLARNSGSEMAVRLSRGDLTAASPAVELLIASLFMALATAVIYLVARDFLPPSLSMAVALVFAFCTPAWSLASRALWMHGPTILMLALALLAAVRSRHNPRWVPFLGAVLALSFFVRPTNAISAAVFTVFVFVEHRRRTVAFLASAAAMTAPFVIANLMTYGSLLAPFSRPQRNGMADFAFHPQFLEAVAANLISPARGLIIYFPLALFALYSFRRPTQQHSLPASVLQLRWYLVSIFALHLILISTFEDWIAGHAYGPRYLSGLIPYFVFLAAPATLWLRQAWRDRRFGAPAVACLLTVFSFLVHFQGAVSWHCWEWNTIPRDITAHRERVWDWADPPFLRGVRGGPPRP